MQLLFSAAVVPGLDEPVLDPNAEMYDNSRDSGGDNENEYDDDTRNAEDADGEEEVKVMVRMKRKRKPRRIWLKKGVMQMLMINLKRKKMEDCRWNQTDIDEGEDTNADSQYDTETFMEHNYSNMDDLHMS